ncbi:MAG: TlpA family protein disulfide reductase [Pseudomonadota bacterium]
MLCLPLVLAFALSACEPPPTDAGRKALETPPADTAPTETAKASDAESGPAAAPERPNLKIATLDGAQYDLASKRGRWVVVNFWATWCAPCIKEMPELDALDAAREDIEVVGLAYEEIAVEDMRAFLAERPVKYPIAIVDTYDPPADFATPRGLPMTYVIAPDGKVAREFMGPVTRADLEAVVDAGAAG